MSDFQKDFLHRDHLAHRRDTPPQVHLAAFGKHPAWNDHMEDIGMGTLTLLEAKRYLYLQGISGQIDSGTWDKTTLTFNHTLLWHRPGEILLGRLLASTDGKGRARYPLVVLAHIINLPLAPALATCAHLIDEAVRAARAAPTSDAVRQTIAQARQHLTTAAATAPDIPNPLAPHARPELSPETWARLYHVIESQLHQYGPGARAENPSSRHLRLPSASAAPAQNLLWWATYWLTQLDPRHPMLLITPEANSNASEGTTAVSSIPGPAPEIPPARQHPIENPYLDLIIGEPSTQHLRCLLSDLDASPTVTDTPYTPSPQITQATNELLHTSDATALPARSLFHLKPLTRDTALATVGTRAGLDKATRPSGLLQKLFG